MKKLLLIILMILVTGCDKNNATGNETLNGKVTDFSKQYLDNGYIINVYRSAESLGDDYESLGKAYITMTFNVITNYTSTTTYKADANYNIKKKNVTNIRVIKTPKKGLANELYSDFSMNGGNLLLGTNNKYETVYDYPHNTGVQTSLAVKINQIALYDETKSPAAANGNQPTMQQIYNELGISRDSVALTLGFRVELTTVDNKVLYKDYEITMPSVNYDITGSEFQVDLTEKDVSKMEPFLEKGA